MARYPVDPTWAVVLRDAGVDPVEVARRAGLPEDLLLRRGATVTAADYFRLWSGLDATLTDPAYPLHLGQSVPVETFDAPLFASLCSPDLNAAMERLSLFKRLVCPLGMAVERRAATTAVSFAPLKRGHALPTSMAAAEMVFVVHLVRLATREPVTPVAVEAATTLAGEDRYARYFGVAPARGRAWRIVFDAADARRPFVTANESMWRFFEPELRRRLATLERDASHAERVRATLRELLPSGRCSIDNVARRLGVSARTLQRRLRAEGTGFQAEVACTRQALAEHYLRQSELSSRQIAYLLGYEDPNSFIRAFHAANGSTPEAFRSGRASS